MQHYDGGQGSGRGASRLCLTTLEFLVDELLSETPDKKIVKDCMTRLGLQYTDDPIERMNTVLAALDQSNRPLKPSKGRKPHEKDL